MKTYSFYAGEVADFISFRYEKEKYLPEFSLWGACFFHKDRKSEWESLMPHIIESLKNEGIKLKSSLLVVPRSVNSVQYYSLMAARNIEAVSERFLKIAGKKSEGMEDLVSDSRLILEAGRDYTKSTENVGWINFLRNAKGKEGREKIYSGLFERLCLRLENSKDLASDSISLIRDASVSDLVLSHNNSYIETVRPKLNPEWEKLAASYSLDSNSIAKETEKSNFVPRSVFGKRRIVSNKGDCTLLDLEELAMKMNSSQRVGLIPDELVKQLVLHKLIDTYTPIFRDDPIQAYARISEHLARANPQERIILNTLLTLLNSVDSFSKNTMTHKTLTLTRRKDE